MDSNEIMIISAVLIVFAVMFFIFRRYYQRQVIEEVKRARKSERLKSVFLANVSHALRTPTNAILGYSNLILEEDDNIMDPKQVKELAMHVKNNSQQLLDFLSKLLELSNFDGGLPNSTLIEVNLAELMASYRREAMTITKSDVLVCLRTDLSPHCKVTLDTNYMHQLMMHLLTDASNHASQGDITINYGSERKGLRVSISYNGVGQAELIGGDIYSFLQKEDALTMGKDNSALSLALCKAIVDVLGGEIDMDTENGRKTVVSFWFPCRMRDRHKNQ